MKRIFLTVLVVMLSLFSCLGNIFAATKLNSNFPDKFQAVKGDKTYTTSKKSYVFKKSYSVDNLTGKAFCSFFQKAIPPTGTNCKLVDWNSNTNENIKIAVGVAAMVDKARYLTTGDISGSIDWLNYLYGEIAINQFLYAYNGKQTGNDAFGYLTKESRDEIENSSQYKAIYKAGETAYNNYGNASIVLSNAQLDGNTAKVDAICKDANGTKVKCNLTSQTVKVGSSSKNLNVVSSTTEKTELSADISDINVDGGNVQFSVTAGLGYRVAQQYDCGTSYQKLVPNMIYEYSVPKTARANIGLCSASIVKQDAQGNQLNGAQFELYEEGDNEPLMSFTVDGSYTLSGLRKGSYILKEIKAPSGYVTAADTPIVLDDNNCSSNQSFPVVNTKDYGRLTIVKKDPITNENVVGAKIKLYTINEAGTYEYVKFDGNDYFVSASEPKVVDNLIVGKTYYAIEDSLPENSDYAIKKYMDVVTIKSGANEVVLENIHSSFKISKQDINSSKEIPGAQLEIFYENGQSTGYKWTSTDEPQEIPGLADGNYILTETTAPKGYIVAESIAFTIENGKLKDRPDNVLVMKDESIVEVPDTFSTANIVTMIIGLLFVTGGSVALAYEYKKRKTA